MTRLSPPDREWYDEWPRLVAEYDGGRMDGSGLGGSYTPDPSRAGFDTWLDRLAVEADTDQPSPDDRVNCTYFWILDDAGAWVGFLSLRHELNDFLFEQGGHIGYSVRPTRRREGHASAALRLALVEAAALGLDPVLVCCDEDNLGSRAVIEGCGGVYEDSRQGRRRYWVPTAG